MKQSLIAVVCAALILPTMALAALAADGQVVVPIGDWVTAGIGVLDQVVFPLVAIVVAWAVKKLPDSIGAYLKTAQVDQLLSKAIGYGLNAVSGAAKGKTLSVNVGNRVISEAVQYAIDHAPKLVEWAGGRDMLVQKIIARLDIEDSAVVGADFDTGRLVLK